MAREVLTWLNDRVGYVRVRTKLTVAFTVLSGLPLIIGGLVGTLVAGNALEEQALGRLNAEADTMRTAFETLLDSISSDLDMLAATPGILRALDGPPGSPAAVSLGEHLGDYLEAKPECVQVQVLDTSGAQALGVQTRHRSLGRQPGTAQPYYANLVAANDPGDVVISAVELTLDDPGTLLPAISLARGVYSEEGELGAILVVNLFAAEVFPERARAATDTSAVIVVDDHGRYLYDSDYEDNWNRFLAERHELDVASRYSGVTHQILSGEEGGLVQANGYIVAFRPMLRRRGHYLVMIHSVPRNEALRSVASIRTSFLVLFGATVAVAALLSRFGAQQFTAPIQRLAEGAQRLEGRDYSHRLPMRGYDELDDLAATFNSMASAIEQRDSHIRAYMQDLESEVVERTEELLHAERLAAVGEMVAGIAHEIGTPLNVISGFAEDLLSQFDEGETTDDLKVIVDETGRIADLVRGLQDFARSRPPAHDWVDIGEVATEVVRLLRGAARADEVQIDVETVGETPRAYVDPQAIKQALLNLVVNAIHASDAGGHVRVHVRAGADKTVITVADDGHGIEADVRERIFDPFFSTKSPGEGTGLGLAIVKRIVESHGGNISVESSPGTGSRFEISLPKEEHHVDPVG